MNKYNKFLLFFALAGMIGCNKKESGETTTPPAVEYTLTVTFENKVNSTPVSSSVIYTTPNGEDYTISKFKYYISNVKFYDSITNKTYSDNGYYLVDAFDSASRSFSIKTNHNKFNRISFLLGVDSARNVSGAQTGALDPAKDMFWTWNSGYIMAKLEGNSSSSPIVNNKMEYHIGGFKTGENVTKNISISFPAGRLIAIKDNGRSEITIKADVNTWFKTPYTLLIANTPACTTPGALAVSISNNFAKMFTLSNTKNF
jgi:hypothetical protein